MVLPKEEHSLPISMMEISNSFGGDKDTLWRDFMFGSHCVQEIGRHSLLLSDFYYIYFVGDLQILGDFVLFQGQFETGGWIYLYSGGVNSL